MTIMINKRNGRKEVLDITKIQKMTTDATANLDGVSQSELELDVQIKFIDGMSSSDIQDALIKTAVEKIDIDVPNWTFVAARLFVFDLYHRVGQATHGIKGEPYCHLSDYLKYGKDAGRLIPNLGEGYDLDDLNSYIEPKRDFLFNYLGIKTLYDRYLIRNNKAEPIELPQHMFMAIAMFLAQDEKNKQQCAKEFYDVISKFEVMLATPTLSNARTNRHQLSSCYIGSSPDNIEGIFDGYKEMSQLSKFGGGIGWDWNQVRALGGVIDNHKNAAGGTVPFLKITNDIAIAVDQLGCVAENSFIKVLDSVRIQSECGIEEIQLREMYKTQDMYKTEHITDVNEHALSYNFEYSDLSQERIKHIISTYICNSHLSREELVELSGVSLDVYKRTINKFVHIKKELPKGFVKLNTYNKLDLSSYAINKDGIIIKCDSFKTCKWQSNRKGYMVLNTDSKTNVPIHRLVYYIFGNDNNISDVDIDHKDNNKLNNNIDNLQKLSRSDNAKKSWNDSDNRIRNIKHRLQKHLKSNHALNGTQRNTENIEIIEYITKTVQIGKCLKGDFVLSFNIDKGVQEFKEIEQKHDVIVEPKDQIKIVYEDGGYIITSKWHPICVYKDEKYKYIRSDELQVNDIGVSLSNNFVKVVEIDHNPNISSTYKDLSVKDNNNYFCSTDIESNEFHVIHNTRKGAIAVYLEPWHMDIVDFIDLKKNSGEERRRAHDLFPALWITDLFMERVLEDAHWTLFDPYEVKDLSELYGDEFKARYIAYEEDDTITKNTMKAKDLWKKVLTSYFESGSPFLCFKDTANRANPNSHVGHIRSSNLCTEIFQNTRPNHYKIKLWLNAGKDYLLFEEDEEVKLINGYVKKANKVTALDTLDRPYYSMYFDNNVSLRVFNVEKEKIDGDTAVCNLASVNLSRINTQEDIERVVPIAVRMLDNVIDLNFYPLNKVKYTNLKSRSIGLGVMGEAEMLADKQVMFGSQEHFNLIDSIMEQISYNTIHSSMELAKEKGAYPTFEGSKWSQGIMPHDHANMDTLCLTSLKMLNPMHTKWEALRNEVKENGMRNGYLMAVAPTSSISILVGTTQAIEPVYKRKWFEENLSGLIPVVVPKLSPETWGYYVPAFEIDQLKIIKAAAIRQKWIDQGQSTNIFMSLDKASGKHLHEIYTLAWKLGLKSTYYLRSQSPEAKNDVADRTIECNSCQ